LEAEHGWREDQQKLEFVDCGDEYVVTKGEVFACCIVLGDSPHETEYVKASGGFSQFSITQRAADPSQLCSVIMH
jgi:hypothetical protein